MSKNALPNPREVEYMHELGMAKDLFKVILEKAAEKNLSRITSVRISTGEASGIEREFLVHSLKDHVFPGTPAEGSDLDISVERVAAVCSGCGKHPGEDDVFRCAFCGGDDFEITGGKDVIVEEVKGVC